MGAERLRDRRERTCPSFRRQQFIFRVQLARAVARIAHHRSNDRGGLFDRPANRLAALVPGGTVPNPEFGRIQPANVSPIHQVTH